MGIEVPTDELNQDQQPIIVDVCRSQLFTQVYTMGLSIYIIILKFGLFVCLSVCLFHFFSKTVNPLALKLDRSV